MVNGPPTPPPTTAAEIQDEAQMNASTSQDSSSTVQTAVADITANEQHPIQNLADPYVLIFPRIAELASQKQYLELVHVAETTEINSDADQQLSRLLVITPLILAYLISNEIPIALLVLRRLPHALITNPLTKALGLVAVAASARDYAQVYGRAEILVDLAGQPDFPDPNLANVIRIMVDSFLTSFRDRTFVLLSKAYSSIPLALAGTYFGMSNAERLLEVATGHNWSYDATTQILTPTPVKELNPAFADASSLATFDFIASSVSRLET